MEGLLTAQAGLAGFSRAFRSLGGPKLCDEHVRIKERERGFTVGQQVESLVLLHVAGGNCMQDIEWLRQDSGVAKMLGYGTPSPRCVGDFLEAFHDPEKVAQALFFHSRRDGRTGGFGCISANLMPIATQPTG